MYVWTYVFVYMCTCMYAHMYCTCMRVCTYVLEMPQFCHISHKDLCHIMSYDVT